MAPTPSGPVETIPVPEPQRGETLQVEDGMLGRSAVLRQARAAREAIARHNPDRIVMLGGDCLVDLAPFAYLGRRYGDSFGLLWVDAHPDVMTPEHFAQGNAMVLGALLGNGDPDLVAEVGAPLRPSRVMYAGLDEWSTEEREVIDHFDLRHVGSDDLRDSSTPVLDWIRSQGITHLAVHLDVDSMDPRAFSAVIFNKPDAPLDFLPGVPRGRLAPTQVVRLLNDVASACDVVGLGIAEFLPWEAI